MIKKLHIYILSISLTFLLLFTGCNVNNPATNSDDLPILCTEFNVEGYLPIRVLIPKSNDKAYVVAFDTTKDSEDYNIFTSSLTKVLVFDHTSKGFVGPKPMSLPDGFTYSPIMAIDPDGKSLYFSAINKDFFGNDSINLARGTIDGDTLTDITSLDALGTTMNQFVGSIDSNDNMIYISSLKDRSNQVFYAPHISSNTSSGTLLSYHVNMNGAPSFGSALSPDGTTLINATLSYYDVSFPSCSLIAAPIKDGQPKTALLLDHTITTEDTITLLPTISGDGTTLYFYQIPALANGNGMTKDGKLYKVDLKSLLNHGVLPHSETNSKYNTATFDLTLRNKGDMQSKSGIYYEIFVRAFADSDGDGIGDFNGITEKLDYLKDLGIDGLWLMPINATDSYHGYSVTDYNTVNSDYGTEEDFKNLLDEAHKRGIKVIMDFVINHTSSGHPWFQDAIHNPNSPYKDYYNFVPDTNTELYNESDTSPWGSPVWWQVGTSHYYGIFSGDMPDLNYNNPKVREEIKKSAAKWLNIGVDGFRLDAAIHIYGNHEFKKQGDQEAHNIQWWNEFASACEAINPNVYLVGEAWEDDNAFPNYVQPFDTKFNFSFEDQMVDALVSESVITKAGTSLAENLKDLLDLYHKVDANYIDAPFASNHDQSRIFSSVNSIEKAKLAANIYLTLPGNPFIYYGEEIGMQGLKENSDEVLRDNFKWSNTKTSPNANWCVALWNWDHHTNDTTIPLDKQQKDPASIYNHYKQIIKLRKTSPALTDGDYDVLTANDFTTDSPGAIMAYKRTKDSQTLSIYHNLSKDSVTLALSEAGQLYYTSSPDALLKGNSLTISPYSTVILTD